MFDAGRFPGILGIQDAIQKQIWIEMSGFDIGQNDDGFRCFARAVLVARVLKARGGMKARRRALLCLNQLSVT